MFGLFEPAYRRVRDEREIRYFYAKYGDETVSVLKARASESAPWSRDRRHWERLARKARRQQRDFLGAPEAD